MTGERWWYEVSTDAGTHRTLAASVRKAERNARWRLVMDRRSYSRPTPRDFEEMREMKIISVRREDGKEEK